MKFSTYLGGAADELARDVFADGQGNIYVTGGTSSANFPRTLGPAYNNGDCASIGSQGGMDAFVMKFSPAGQLLWSRLLGGPCYDRAYAIEVDAQGYIYIAGRAGRSFPVTAGAVQTTFQGQPEGIYGDQNAFAARLSPDGATVVWATYVGVGDMARDLAIDAQGNVYLPLAYTGSGGTPPAAWFINAYQKDLHGGSECGAVKLKSDGTQALWATWLGGSQDESSAASIRVDAAGSVFLVFYTDSTDLPTTTGAYDRTHNGQNDYYLAHLSASGANLLYATYYGGAGNEWVNTHNLALDGEGNAYISVWTDSTNLAMAPGAAQPMPGGGASEIVIAKFSPAGALLKSTFLGGSGAENPDGISMDGAGGVFLTGNTDSTDFPVTAGSFQPKNGGSLDAVLVRLSADFSQVLYATYLGGGSSDDGRASFLGQDGSLYVAGTSNGSGWPTKSAFQGAFAGRPQDAVLARFFPTAGPPGARQLFMPIHIHNIVG